MPLCASARCRRRAGISARAWSPCPSIPAAGRSARCTGGSNRTRESGYPRGAWQGTAQTARHADFCTRPSAQSTEFRCPCSPETAPPDTAESSKADTRRKSGGDSGSVRLLPPPSSSGRTPAASAAAAPHSHTRADSRQCRLSAPPASGTGDGGFAPLPPGRAGIIRRRQRRFCAPCCGTSGRTGTGR